MLADMHKRIVNIVYEAIHSELGIDLNVGKLKYGSIFPDINPLMLHIPHTLEGSLNFVTKKMNGLTRDTFAENKSSVDKFSFTLGMIIHFLSDYFCRAHIDKKYRNLLTHYFYEKRLKVYFRSMLIRQKSFGLQFTNRTWQLETNLEEFICMVHQEYCRKKHTMRNDIRFSIFISTVIGLNIVQRVIENSTDGILKTA